MLFSSIKHNRLHTCVERDKKYLHKSAISDKTYSRSLPKSKSIESTKPLLCFTSFQHYLEDCNQNEFHKKENQKFYRSANKAKTQAYFTYQREKSNSFDSKTKNIKNFTLEDSVIQNFYPQDEKLIKNRNNNRSNQNAGSKSSSDNYLQQNHSRTEGIFSEKFGTIQGWNSEQKCDKNERVFLSSKSILQERKLNSIKNRILKTSQNSFRKEQKQKSIIQANSNQQQKKSFKSKKCANKENIQCQKIQQNSPKQSLTQQQLFRPIEICQKQKNKNHLLTSINQLEEEILLSKREPNFPESSSSRYKKNDQTFHLQALVLQQNSNIKILKRQFEYLCKDDFDEEIEEFHKSSSSQIQPHSFVKNIKNQHKYFKRFPNFENKQNSTCYPFETENFLQKTNRPKTTNHEINLSSPSMLKILQSITQSTNEKRLYEAKTPLKKNMKIPMKIPQSDFNTPHNMKSISKHKEKFHSSLKDRKSHSAFYHKNGFGEVQKNAKNLNVIESNEKGQNQLEITVISSFKTSGSEQQRKLKWNTKNNSLQKNIKKRLYTYDEISKKEDIIGKSEKSVYLFEKDFLSHLKGNHSQEMNEQQNFDDIRINEQLSICQTIDILHQTSHENNISTQQNESLEKLNLLSEQLKNCAKIPGSVKHVSLVNKKFMYLNKASRIKQRENNQQKMKEKKKNVIHKLMITQLEGRHIQKMRKRFDLNNE